MSQIICGRPLVVSPGVVLYLISDRSADSDIASKYVIRRDEIIWRCTNVTDDRQTDRQTDGRRHIANMNTRYDVSCLPLP